MVEPTTPRAPRASTCLAAAALALTVATACAKRGPRDLGSPGSAAELSTGALDRDGDRARPYVAAAPTARGTTPRVLVRVEARALATDATHLYFGDAAGDSLSSVEKLPARGAARERTKIARRAPMPGGLALDADDAALVWIASPGDAVLRVPAAGGAPVTIRDRAIFTDVVASAGDVFVTEARGTGGVLTRVTGTTAAELASFEGSPRGLAVDGDAVYLATSSGLLSTTRARGVVTSLARGGAFSSPFVEGPWLYATRADPALRGRALVRVRRTGGDLETVAPGVRDAPIAVHRGVVYWFDADRPALIAAPAPPARDGARRAPRLVSTDPSLERPNAIAVDDDGAFVATGHGDEARIAFIALP
ncbi:MAG: hypothetical protein KF894_29550 [Labilithrix sp.]|nr:hypothetical protein [Labilithrix sp.]